MMIWNKNSSRKNKIRMTRNLLITLHLIRLRKKWIIIKTIIFQSFMQSENSCIIRGLIILQRRPGR